MLTNTRLIATCAVALHALGAHAQTAYTDEAAFQTALGGPITLVNLDDGTLGALTPPYRVEDLAPAAAFAALGLDFVLVNAEVGAGQAGQISKPDRDRLIFNGNGNDGEIAFNLTPPVRGVGAWTNVADGGRILAYSAPDLGGTLLGEAPLGVASEFAGLIANQDIHSVRVTCEFNFDLRCGVYDIQFGAGITDTDGDGIEDGADNCTLVANADQRDSNGDGYGNVCDADLNGDCVVNVLDLGILRTVFFSADADADFNGDGTVNVLDLAQLRVQFFGPPGPSGVTNVCTEPAP